MFPCVKCDFAWSFFGLDLILHLSPTRSASARDPPRPAPPPLLPPTMEGMQDLRLTWVNYSQKLMEAFNKFLSRESLCNVTLSVNRRSIKAHQV